jgi:hydrogenase expression/formation protein HypC
MVHVGFAISRVDAEEAERTLALLSEMGALADELGSPEDAADATAKEPARTDRSKVN